MASSSDVQAALEPRAEVERQAAGACDDNGSAPAATALPEETGAAEVPVKQHDTAPEMMSAPEEPAMEEEEGPAAAQEEAVVPDVATADDQEESTRERLKRHRREMAGRVWVPELWGQEKLLKDWVDCAAFDRPLVPAGLLTARRALVAEFCTRSPDRTSSTAASASSSQLRVQNGCS